MNASNIYREWLYQAERCLKVARYARWEGARADAAAYLADASQCRREAQRVLRRMKINRGLLRIR